MGLHRAEENLDVAKRENQAVLLEENFESNYEGYDPNSPIGHIILSAYQNLYLEQSISIAADIENRFSKRNSYKSRGVKQAGFVVLRRATMPSILIETGFLSNKKEEKYLNSKKGQEEIAGSISHSLGSMYTLYSKDTASKQQKAKPKTQATATTEEAPVFTIQIGVFSSDNKEDLVKSLTDLGNLDIRKVGSLYRYTLGAFSDRTSAEYTLSKVKEKGMSDAYIRAL